MSQWKILPEAPIWGVARLIVRSRRPLRAGQEFAYPQAVPAGYFLVEAPCDSI